MRLALIVVAMSLLAGAASAQECSAQPPSRVSSLYWGYLETCGCDKVSAVPAASPDYKRFQKVCSQWRERHPRPGVIVVAPSPEPGALSSPAPMVITPPVASTECSGTVPSRASDAYWSYIETCGCDKLPRVTEASPDYQRFLKSCAAWRDRNPSPLVIVAPSPQP